MEILDIILSLTSSLLIILITLKVSTLTLKRREEGKQVPGPWNLPIIGSLHHVIRPHPPHQSFRNLSAVYGHIMQLKLGDNHIVVISSSEGAREIMKTHDIDFATRPTNDSINTISYGANDIVFGSYGELWRQMRRLCTLELLSTKRVRAFRQVREDEACNLIRFLAASSDGVVNMTRKMEETSNNIIARAAIGGRCNDQKLFLSALSDVVEFLSGFTLADLFPSMPFISMNFFLGDFEAILRLY